MLFYQTFEWITMLYIIQYQKDKSLGEITYILFSQEKHKRFRQYEYWLRFVYFVIVCLNFYFGNNFYAYSAPVVLMVLVLALLLFKLRKFHHYEYTKNRNTLIFMCSMIFTYYSFMFYHIGAIIGFFERGSLDHILLPLFYLGCFKFYIIMILVHFKPIKDPLEGISKLDLLILVSINQKKTRKFTQSAITSASFCEMEFQEKNDFKDIMAVYVDEDDDQDATESQPNYSVKDSLEYRVMILD